MSRKLATTIKDSAIPGKYKRVLEAYAAFANNDGTNIYAAQTKVAQKAGITRRTIVRITPDLIASGVLRHGKKHTCKVKWCNGGSTHYCGHIGKWTNVYEINLGLVQNVPNLLVTNCLKACGAKCRKPRAAKCLTDSGIKETPALLDGALGKEQDSSAVPLVSKKASKPVTLATASLAPASLAALENQSQNLLGYGNLSSEEQNQEQPQHQLPQSREEMYDAPMSDASELLHIITPNVTDAMVREQLPLCARILEFFPHADEYAVKAAELVLGFNRAHRSGKYATKDDKKLYIRNAAQYLKALESSTASLLNDYDNHDFKNCETCRESGVFDYKAFVREIRKDQEREAEQKKRDAANAIQQAKLKAERERKERLCPECQKTDRGEHIMSSIGGWVKVCNACYDKRYESEQEHIAKMGGWRNNLRKPLEPRPEYAAAKEAEARAAIAKAMDDAEEDVPLCPQCHRAGKNPKGFQKHWDNCPVFREGMMQALQPVAKAAAAPKGFDVEEA